MKKLIQTRGTVRIQRFVVMKGGRGKGVILTLETDNQSATFMFDHDQALCLTNELSKKLLNW